uniref:E3 ubiquitin-protein ligase TRIM39-like n=1 Tax=Periophthalmus magnuspinnatus TaxID=409849 RepID=A0A3B4B8B8_9GOBI
MSSSLEDHLLCSICLDLFTDPVSTPCEHIFCRVCITKHWESSSERRCPLCKTSFSVRPDLRVNPETRSMKNMSSSEVQCDVCSEPKLKALKSCLVCLSSFCESHLQPHLTVSGLKRHQLMEPVENLEDRMCPTHQRPLELFCATDEKCVCMMCSVLEHKNHEFLPLKDAFEEQKASVEKSMSENRRRMLNRRQKMEEIRAVLEQSQTQAETQMQEMVEIFSELVENVQSCLDQYSEIVEKTLTKHEERAQALMSELEQEICDLEQSSTEAECLSRSHDPLLFLQRCTALTPPVRLKEWSSVIFKRAAFEGTTVRALSALGNDLSKTQRRVQEAELKRVQRCAVDVTLDPDTAHCKLILSKDNKKVHQSDSKKKSPENEERFSESCLVLGRPAFSSGRFYFEVQVDEKTPWQIGLVTVSIDRKQQVTLRPSAGVWAVELGEGEQYRALDEAPVPLSPRRPLQKVGVFADHIEGVVSFHDVDTGDIVFSFSGCDFTEDLIPFLSPGTRSGKNSAPLVITTTTVEEQDMSLQDRDGRSQVESATHPHKRFGRKKVKLATPPHKRFGRSKEESTTPSQNRKKSLGSTEGEVH